MSETVAKRGEEARAAELEGLRAAGVPLGERREGPPSLLDVRELRLRYAIPASGMLEFLRGLARGVLVGSKCAGCGLVMFPPSQACRQCGSSAEALELSGEATLETYTQICAKPSSFQHYPDYIVAVGRMKEGPAVVAWLEGASLEQLKPGMRLRLRVKRREPEGFLTYCFEPWP
jgi:uncharacterized OB-fold protein